MYRVNIVSNHQHEQPINAEYFESLKNVITRAETDFKRIIVNEIIFRKF